MPARDVSPVQVFARNAHETGLLGDTFQKKKSPATLVSALGGIRGDRLDQAHLVLAARLPDYTPAHLLKALQEKRTLVRTWGARGVLQIIPTPELPLYLAAAGVTAPRWRRFLDARSNLSTTARLRLLKRLCPGDISRDDLREAIPDATTRLFMLREAAQGGHIVWKDGDGQQSIFTWTRDWLGKAVEPDREYHELLDRYLASYGPVDAADLAGWLGVTVAAARRLLAKHRVEEVQVEGEPTTSFLRDRDLESLVRMRKTQSRGTVVIPPGDPFLAAYKVRYRAETGAGEADGLVFVDSRPAAVWSLGRSRATVRFLDDTGRDRILKAVNAVLARAEAGIEAREESEAEE